jgi:tripartite-type tricarboxylate transporter receptor subunit TctC
VAFAALALVVSGLAGCARAPANPATDAYPVKAVHLIVPYPAGGGADFWGRLVAAKISATLGRPVVVDTVPGAGGNVGTAALAHARPDGYTLLLGSTGPLAVHPFTYDALPFDPTRDFEPIALLESSPVVLVVHPSVKAPSLSDLVALAKARPGGLSFASNGNGSPEQIAGVLFDERAQVDIRHVPFDGAGPARKALAHGDVTMMFDPCKAALPAIKEGKERALAVASASRLSMLPDVPTFAEAGVRDFELRIWTGVLAPKGTPAEIVSTLNRAIREALDAPDVKQALAEQGSLPGRTSPQEFSDFIDAERARWRELAIESDVPRVPLASLARDSRASSETPANAK